MNTTTSTITYAWRLMVTLALGAGILAGPPITTRARTDAPLDLAALILHSDDLDWLIDEVDFMGIEGYPFGTSFSARHTTIDEAVSDGFYAQGRGSLDLVLPGGEDVVSILEDTGWTRTQDQLLVLAEPGHEDAWAVGVGVTIEEFASEEGAEEAFESFEDGQLLANLTEAIVMEQQEAPSLAFDIPTVRWSVFTMRDPSFGFWTQWAQMDNLIVSVAIYTGTEEMNDDVLVPLLDLQLKRLQYAEHLHQPHLSQCAPRLGNRDLLDFHEEYDVLDGGPFAAIAGTSYRTLEDKKASAASGGLTHSYITDQRIGDAVWFAATVSEFSDGNKASEHLAEAGSRLEDVPLISDFEEVDDLPDLGDDAVAFTFVTPDGYFSSVILFQDGTTVFMIALASIPEHQTEAAIDLAEAQIERMEDDSCDDALELPDDLFDSTVPSTREALLITRHA